MKELINSLVFLVPKTKSCKIVQKFKGNYNGKEASSFSNIVKFPF